MELLIVSSNRPKIRHLKECIKAINPSLHVRSLWEETEYRPIPEEEGESLQESATRKALWGLNKTSLPCLADETALIIPSLGSNQRFLDTELRKHAPQTLLQTLQGKEELERSAYLETALTLVIPGSTPTIHQVLVRQEGSLAEKASGNDLFDFGDLFLKHEYNKTLAELPDSIRVRISHRRKELEKLLLLLER